MPASTPLVLRLDRSRYHSSEHGDHPNPIRFWQDGLPFDAHGQLCVEHCSPAQLAKSERKAPKRQIPDVGDQRSDSDIRHPTSDIDPGEVNLELWATGQARYVPARVFAAIRERYNKSVSSFADAIEFLVNDVKLIPAGQASKKLLGAGGPAPVREEA